MDKLLVHAWSVHKGGSSYYLPYTHWVYIKEIVKYYDSIVLLAPCRPLVGEGAGDMVDIASLGSVSVYELPASYGGYISALRNFPYYLMAYRNIGAVSCYYARYPTPFGWLQKVYSGKSKRVIHYVGDPVDAAANNPNFSWLKKRILISGFFLENALYTWACKGAKVYTNGHHLTEKLRKKGVSAVPLISSTLVDEDFFFCEKSIDASSASFVYLGYLRTAKGVETVIRAFALYNKEFPNSSLSIIGSGEFESQLKGIISAECVRNVRFLGRLESRDVINKELRSADVFLFASLSEGSPRVVLEAMANGLAVVSTPVGSLPAVFTDGEDIVFANANDPVDFCSKMKGLVASERYYNSVRFSSFNKVRDFTLEKFIREVFHG